MTWCWGAFFVGLFTIPVLSALIVVGLFLWTTRAPKERSTVLRFDRRRIAR